MGSRRIGHDENGSAEDATENASAPSPARTSRAGYGTRSHSQVRSESDVTRRCGVRCHSQMRSESDVTRRCVVSQMSLTGAQ